MKDATNVNTSEAAERDPHRDLSDWLGFHRLNIDIIGTRNDSQWAQRQ